MIIVASKDSLIERFLMLEEISHEEALYTLNIIVALLVYAENSTISIINKWYEQFAKNGIITVEDVKDVLTPSELRKFKSLLARYIEECRYYELEREYIEELEYTIKRNKINRLDMLKIQLKHCYYISYNQIYNQLDTMVKKVYSEGYFSTIYEVQRYIGKWYKVNGIPETMLNRLPYIAWSDDNWNIVKRIKQLRKWKVKDITNIVTKAIEFERPLEDTKFKISQISHKEKVRMGRITRTEQAFYNSLAQFNAYKTLEIEAYQIIAVIDDRTSDICRSLNGRRFLLDDYEVYVTAPPFHPNCRSTTRPYLKKELVWTIKSPDIGYSEWKKKYIK
jgi:SPP1 gp7 family putative phage head morphogenesis protein